MGSLKECRSLSEKWRNEERERSCAFQESLVLAREFGPTRSIECVVSRLSGEACVCVVVVVCRRV